MQTRYRASFPVATTDRVVERLAELCGAWRNMPVTEAKQLEFGHRWADGGQSVESRFVAADRGLVWGLRHSMSDPESADLTWMTDVGLVMNDGSGWISISNHISTDGISGARPIRRTRTRPRIVVDAVRTFGTRSPLGPQARVLGSTSAAVMDFLREVYSPERSYPIVLVSCRNDTDRPVINADQLADWLVGIASVVRMETRFPALRLREHLPSAVGCWDGAVRLYWPGFSTMDPPHVHRLWLPDSIRDLGESGGVGFHHHLLAVVCDLLAHRRLPNFIDWSDITRLAAEQEVAAAIARAKSEGNEPELVSLLESENRELTKRSAQLLDEVGALSSRVDGLEAECDYWRSQARAASGESDSAARDIDAIASVGEAVEWAKEAFGGKLAFALNNKSDPDSVFSEPAEVARALQWLATTYREVRLDIRRCQNLDLSIRQECSASWFWRGGQSEITASSFANWYECSYNGRKYGVLEHIGTGRSKRPEETIRIAFTWLEDDEMVLIGYIGQHQRTAKT